MARCEDFPCCGHESGECPRYNAKGERLCVNGCSGKSVIHGECQKCLTASRRRSYTMRFDGTGQDQETYY